MAEKASISLIYVNYKAGDHILNSLRSIQGIPLYESTEVIVVDNNSEDGSRELVKREFPETKWIDLKNNIGFGSACNVGAQESQGEYLFFVNPDTMLMRNTLEEMVSFMEKHPDAGLAGPKVLNSNGTLQENCHRSFPTPVSSFFHTLKLDKLFPKSRLFGRYNLTYLNPDEVHEVDAVSGSFMFFRRDVFREIGGFDNEFFMYGEDLDICIRVKDNGKKVYYNPRTSVVHFKGRSSAKRYLKSRIDFYEAMIIFSKKYKDSYGAFFPEWLLFIGIWGQAVINLSARGVKVIWVFLLDLVLINSVMILLMTLRYHYSGIPNPYYTTEEEVLLLMHLVLSGSFLAVFAYRGMYSASRYSDRNAVVSSIYSIIVFFALLFFIKQIAFSRVTYTAVAVFISVLLPGWRKLFYLWKQEGKNRAFITGRVVLIGNSNIVASMIEGLERDPTARIAGIVWPESGNYPGQFMGYQVLGTLENLSNILHNNTAEILIIATSVPWYSYLIEAISINNLKNMRVKWLPAEYLSETSQTSKRIKTLPLRDFSV